MEINTIVKYTILWQSDEDRLHKISPKPTVFVGSIQGDYKENGITQGKIVSPQRIYLNERWFRFHYEVSSIYPHTFTESGIGVTGRLNQLEITPSLPSGFQVYATKYS